MEPARILIRGIPTTSRTTRDDAIRVELSIEDQDRVSVDPTSLTFRFKNPSANVTAYVFGTDAELVKDAVGEYHVDVDLDEAGRWIIRVEAGGDYQAAEERDLWVRESEVV